MVRRDAKARRGTDGLGSSSLSGLNRTAETGNVVNLSDLDQVRKRNHYSRPLNKEWSTMQRV